MNRERSVSGGFEDYVRIAKHCALGQTEALFERLGELEGSSAVVANHLARHHLIRLIRAAAPESELAQRVRPDLLAAMASRRPVQPATTLDLLRGLDEVGSDLRQAAIPFLLLKGFYFAHRLYGGLERRPQRDLDILVEKRTFRRVIARLQRLGFEERNRDLHSRTLERREVQIDVHWCLRNCPAYRLDEKAVWSNAVPYSIDERHFHTLSDGHTISLLSMSLFQDLGIGMGKLKQFIDLYLLVRTIDRTFDWPRFFADRTSENLDSVCAKVLAAMLLLFDASDEIPELARSLGPDRRCSDKSENLRLLEQPRWSLENQLWFCRNYPGSLAYYRLWLWRKKFPGNLKKLSFRSFRSNLAMARQVVRLRRTETE